MDILESQMDQHTLLLNKTLVNKHMLAAGVSSSETFGLHHVRIKWPGHGNNHLHPMLRLRMFGAKCPLPSMSLSVQQITGMCLIGQLGNSAMGWMTTD